MAPPARPRSAPRTRDWVASSSATRAARLLPVREGREPSQRLLWTMREVLAAAAHNGRPDGRVGDLADWDSDAGDRDFVAPASDRRRGARARTSAAFSWPHSGHGPSGLSPISTWAAKRADEEQKRSWMSSRAHPAGVAPGQADDHAKGTVPDSRGRGWRGGRSPPRQSPLSGMVRADRVDARAVASRACCADLLTAADAARVLGVSRQRVHQLVVQGHAPAPAVRVYLVEEASTRPSSGSSQPRTSSGGRSSRLASRMRSGAVFASRATGCACARSTPSSRG